MDVPVLCVECEGVLVETASARRAALADALAAEGLTLDEATWTAVRHLAVEPGAMRARERLGAPEDGTAVTLAVLRAEQAFADRIARGVTLTPALLPTVERLSAVARLAIVSRAARRELEALLAQAGCAGLFRPVLGAEDLTAGLPAAWKQAVARTPGHLPDQRRRPVVVSDALEVVRAARGAALGTILIGARPAHEALEADLWLESLADLTPDRLRALHRSLLGDRP